LSLTVLLFGMEFLDELYSGVPAIGAPAIQRDFSASYQLTAWVLLLIPGLVALVIEPFLFLLADRHPRVWFVRGGAIAMAASAFAAAVAPNLFLVALAVALAYLASGCGVSMAQATLVDAYPEDRERILTRWTMLGVVGDLAGPVLFAGLAALAIGWRAAYAIVGAAIAVWTFQLCRVRFPPAAAPEGQDGREERGGRDERAEAREPHEPLLAALWSALRNRRLVAWLFGTALCELLDEILVVFASLHMRDVHGAGAFARSAALAGLVAGQALGLFLTERLLRTCAPLRLLAVSSAACAASYLAWIAVPTPWLSFPLLFVVGVTAAPLYPIAMAQAYAALPGRSGAVQAAGHVFTPLTMLLPWFLGWLADRYGTGAALVALAAQPIGLVILAVVWQRKAGATKPPPAICH